MTRSKRVVKLMCVESSVNTLSTINPNHIEEVWSQRDTGGTMMRFVSGETFETPEKYPRFVERLEASLQ